MTTFTGGDHRIFPHHPHASNSQWTPYSLHISRTNCNAIVDFDAIQGPSWMPESNASFATADDPTCPQWHVRASPTISNQPHDSGTCQYLTQPTTRVRINELKFQRPLLSQACTAHEPVGISWKTINPIFHVTKWVVPFPRFPMYSRWLVSIPLISMYDWFHFLLFPIWLVMFRWWLDSLSDWQRPGDGGFSVLASTAKWSLHPDW